MYQMCETGSSVENFLRSSQGNELSTSELYTNEEVELDMAVYGTQQIEKTPTININEDFTNHIEKENEDPNFKLIIEDHASSSKNSVCNSGVSEGSIVVQDLPKSKIVFATQKTIDKELNHSPYRNPIRHKDEKKQIVKHRVRKPSNYCERIVKEDSYYCVGSSLDLSDSLSEAMWVEVEEEK